MIDDIEPQESLMSPVVRQSWPRSPAHSQGLFSPHSQMLYTIGRPVAASASRMVVYRCFASTPWLLQLSYLR